MGTGVGTVAGFRVRDGNVTATVSDDLERLIRLSVENVLPGVLAEMEREVAPVLAAARAAWPVETGKSRDGLVQVTTLDTGKSEVSVGIRDDVPYAIFVKPSKAKSTSWQTLVRGPMGEVQKRVAVTLGPAILRALRAT
jgi:hypothetical protein